MTETMPAELADNLIDFCENRRRVYALLSRCYERELDAPFAKELAEAALESDDPALAEGFAALKADLAACDDAALEELAVVFNRAFFGMGPRTAQKAFPYESVYTSEGGLMMQDAYSEVLGLYRAAGFAKDPGFTEPEDHLAIELAFMALLCGRAVEALRAGDEAGAERQLRAQASFAREHLLNWVPVFACEMRAAAEGGFYEHLASFTEAYLDADARALAEVVE
ncbi:TorD/DmsD family molecular chaperone [Arabiibacter massiliensis]|uniref:TorD/DmsD family molecular chaperone n=1 Tax=Arabiibacter massiliensis TaxID=1870985 RepID=UPI0009BA38B7|nr:molecular chaperone TorD family protein [Arabiibacter massiliensis]